MQKKGDRVIIVGKKHNGANGKFVHYSGHSIVVQLDKGKTFNPSPNSVKLVKPKYRSKIEETKVKKILPLKEESVKKILPLKEEKKMIEFPLVIMMLFLKNSENL